MAKKSAPPSPFPAMHTTRAVFVRAVGVVFLIAFVSLWVQVDALVGPQGLLPADAFLERVDAFLVRSGAVTENTGLLGRWGARLTTVPTLGWLLPDGGTGWLCLLGTLASIVVITGRFAAPALLVCWATYLSLSHLGQAFLSFQWDTLLVEVGFATLLLAPWGRHASQAAPEAGWWLVRFILFKLVFFGGLVKLTSGDPTWWDGTALTFHYETQPLPNPVSWFAHQLPYVVHALSALAMFVLELVLPFGLFGPRRARQVAGAGIAALMGLLALTGNYGFFQLLTLVLCLSVVDDPAWRWALRGRTAGAKPATTQPVQILGGVVATVLIAVSLLGIPPRYLGTPLPPALETVRAAVAPFRTVNHYGLFARMTTTRPIPVLEARWGESGWTEIPWRWQTSDVMRRPQRVAPHMPRLDWQLWFAGLGTCARTPWAVTLLDRLLAGDREVAGLVGDLKLLTAAPPDAVRLVRFTYRFAPSDDPEGRWWVRERDGLYCPERSR